MIPNDIILAQRIKVQNYFAYWQQYMRKIEFWEIPGNLDIHTQGHSERVLLLALRIGAKLRLSDRQLTALAEAAIFHDTRRKDNYLDRGHGERAAEYYKKFCGDTSKELEYLPEAYAAIYCHDKDDEEGKKYITYNAGKDVRKWMDVYEIFKDADALDRLRLGKWCLDPGYLRTMVARNNVAFAQELVERTIPREELEKTYELMEPYHDHAKDGFKDEPEKADPEKAEPEKAEPAAEA